MLGNTAVASIDAAELEALPAEARAFHRRARIIDAAVRETAEHGYEKASEAQIAERAGVTRQVFYDVFRGKEEILICAYDHAAAYAMPQILRALRAEDEWERGIAAALSMYLTILDCDPAWALVCLRDVPAAGDRARAVRDAACGPILDALQAQANLPAAIGVSFEAILATIDVIVVDGLYHEPDQPLRARQQELAALAFAPFTGAAPPADVGPTTVRPSPAAEEIQALLRQGAGDLEMMVREAAVRRDGPTLWQVIAAIQRRRAAGEEGFRRAERAALAALGDAWFFGLPLDQPDDALAGVDLLRYLRYVAAHPGCNDEDVRSGLGVRHLSQVNRALRGLEADGLLRRRPGPGGTGRWWAAATPVD
jgi:AcrR family transcriptional regulator